MCASLVRQCWTDPDTGDLRWYCRDLASAARCWSQVVVRARYGARCASGRYLEVRYERLVAEPEQQMRRVLAFLGDGWGGWPREPERAPAAQGRRQPA